MNSQTRGWIIFGSIWLSFTFGCGPESGKPVDPTVDTDKAMSESIPFIEAAVQTGLVFTHENGRSGEYFYCEILGGGGAVFDFDQDGDLDVFLAQGRKLSAEGSAPAMRHGLFRNDLIGPNGTRGSLSFTEIGQLAGIQAGDYGMGAAVGDVDNDGFPDLYVTNFEGNRLYRNMGNGTFEDVTESSGTSDDQWSVSAAFFDYDGDGWLDLFIGNYADYRLELNKVCYGATRDYCSPLAYGPLPDRLLRNRGDGTFEDVSAKAGITTAFGRALGVVTGDLNGDNLPDIYVANDGTVNQFWINQGDGTFFERAVMSGNGLNESGLPEAGMGVDAGDFDGDGDEDLFVTHLFGETNTIYRNDGSGFFEDVTNISGLGAPSQPFTGFGTAWIDYDLDGQLDLFVANGAVTKMDTLLKENDPFPFKQRNQLFRNMGNGNFRDVSLVSGSAFGLARVSRGAIFGDLDNDGDEDVIVTNNGGPASLLVNQAEGQVWVGLRLVDPRLRRDVLGAKATLRLQSGRVLIRRARTDASYASALDSRIIFGLGDGRDPIESLEVIWPGGQLERWQSLVTGRWTEVSRGSGEAMP